MKKGLVKNTLRSIRRSFSRFLAIMIIVATGFAFFAGIKAAGPDMLATAKKYYNDNNLMDLRIQSDLGLTAADAQAVSAVEGVDYVMPQKFVDALVWVNGAVESDIDGAQISARAYGINLQSLSTYASGVKDPAFINRPDLLEGRYPTAENECLVDASALSTPDSYQIGNVITLGGDGTSIDLSLSVTEFTIVGIIRSPYYVSFERGNSLVGGAILWSAAVRLVPIFIFRTASFWRITIRKSMLPCRMRTTMSRIRTSIMTMLPKQRSVFPPSRLSGFRCVRRI